MIDKDFEESGDDTADEYESDNISGDNASKYRNQYSLHPIGVN